MIIAPLTYWLLFVANCLWALSFFISFFTNIRLRRLVEKQNRNNEWLLEEISRGSRNYNALLQDKKEIERQRDFYHDLLEKERVAHKEQIEKLNERTQDNINFYQGLLGINNK